MRKKPRLLSAVTKSSLKEVPFVEKTKVGSAPPSSARVKHLIGIDSKKVGGMRNIRDVSQKFPTDKLRDCDLPREEVNSRTSSLAKRQRDANILFQNSSRLHRSREED